MGFVHQLRSREGWHHDIGEQQIHGFGPGKQGQCFLATGDGGDAVAERFQLAAGEVADEVIVFHQQDMLPIALQVVPGEDGAGWGRAHVSPCCRQDETECGSLAQFGTDIHHAARLTHEAIYHRQSQASAIALRLGAVKRLEDAIKVIWRNTCPGIAHREHHVLSRCQFLFASPTAYRHAVAGKDKLAALGHGVATVDAQVEQGVFQLARVDAGEGNVRVLVLFDPDVAPYGALQQGEHVVHQQVDVDRLR